MEREVRQSTFTLVVATENYAERYRGDAPKEVGRGATWEGAIVTSALYRAGARNDKFLPVVFSKTDIGHIPEPLQSSTYFQVDTEEGYDALYRLITGQPSIVPASVGRVRHRPIAQEVAPKGAPRVELPIHDHAIVHSNLPRMPYGFFGREDELRRIADVLAPEARAWGVLIDGPGGIGKTALAIRAAELTPVGQFRRVVFLSSKTRELTPDGERALENFVVPAYLDMLNNLARQIGKPELTNHSDIERSALLQEALQTENALLIFDNLESLTMGDRERLFEFLSRLPRGCKAIVTSRRRTDIDARVIRLERLAQPAALEFIAKLAEDRPLLFKATDAERVELYAGTGGNPLLIRWVAGQLGQGHCRTVKDALSFIAKAPKGNDPLEFIFGDLAASFTAAESRALAALSHFTLAAEVRFVAEVAELSQSAAQTALDDLAGRALVTAADSEGRTFTLMPQVAHVLRTSRPNDVDAAKERLDNYAYTLIMENTVRADQFHQLEGQWPVVAAALPVFLEGPNQRLQSVCAALVSFFHYYGHLDEWLSLERQAEERAVQAQDWLQAGWRAYRAGYALRLLGFSPDIFAHADRAETHWRSAKAGAREHAAALQLRGLAYALAGDHSKAIGAFRGAVELDRGVAPDSADVANDLNTLAGAELSADDLVSAEDHLREALRIANAAGYDEGVAYITTNLTELALQRKDWAAAEGLARTAMDLSRRLGRKALIAQDHVHLAKALIGQGLGHEARSHASRAVEILSVLPFVQELDRARAVLADCP